MLRMSTNVNCYACDVRVLPDCTNIYLSRSNFMSHSRVYLVAKKVAVEFRTYERDDAMNSLWISPSPVCFR